jgi:GLPGLI family protein
MKKIFLIIFLTTFVSVVKAQKYKLNYKLIYSPDTTDVKKTKNELFTLFIVDSVSRFVSNKKLLKDSIAFKAKFDKNLALELLANQEKIPKSDFKFDIFKIDNSQILVYEDIFFDKYLYEEKIEEFNNWKIKQETLMVKGIECQRATLNYEGRVYEAWFTDIIPIKNGPYKFSGLPGLIMKIQDTNKEYVFDLVSIKYYEGNILIPNKEGVKTVIKIDFFKASKNRLKNIKQKVKHKIILSDDAKSYLSNRYKSFNNPIEFITN